MKTDAVNPSAEQYDPQKYRLKLRPVIVALVVFYICAILLNANGIKRDIELMKYGRLRNISLSIFNPIADFSNLVGLTKFRTIIEESIGAQIRNAKINP